MSRFSVVDLPLPGLKRVARASLGDTRGFLSRMFCAEELSSAGWVRAIAQINHTYTARRGSVRGLHFQYPPHGEMKLVSCIRGEVWDVAVDLREGSPTFLRWHAERLSRDNGNALLIPEGFAHGFQTLEDDCELIYFHSAPYRAEAEGGVRFDDPKIGVGWPLAIADISDRDQRHPLLKENFEGIRGP